MPENRIADRSWKMLTELINLDWEATQSPEDVDARTACEDFANDGDAS